MMNSNDTQKILDERGAKYGEFRDHATITQQIKHAMRSVRPEGWARMTPHQREALDMIAHKIGRIVNGDPEYDDSWKDIIGYAQLVLERLPGYPKGPPIEVRTTGFLHRIDGPKSL